MAYNQRKLTVRLTPDKKEELMVLAFRLGTSMQDLVESAIDQLIANPPSPEPDMPED